MLEVRHLCFVTPETTPSSSLWPGEKRNAVEVSKNNILSRPGWYGWKVSHNCEVSIDDYWSFLMTCCVSVAAEYLFIMDGLRVVLWDAAADVADGGGRDWQYDVNSNGKISLLCEPGRSSCTVYTQQCSDVCLIKTNRTTVPSELILPFSFTMPSALIFLFHTILSSSFT